MAVSFLGHELSDLCLGKPALRSLPVSATVADAVSALKRSGKSYVSVWTCEHSSKKKTTGFAGDDDDDCRCIGKVCMVDVLCFLCREENLKSPSKALESPVSDVLPKVPGLVKHLEPNSSLLEAIDCILEGAQNLVLPIQSHTNTKSRKKVLNKPNSFRSTHHNGREFCWLTQEDVIRFLLNSIGVFSPIPTFTIESLNIIDMDTMAVHYHEPASTALASISRALTEQTSVAVIDEDNRLIGEISPITLACCDESVAAAITTLSAGDLMAYIDCGGPPEDLVQLVKMMLEEKNLGAMLELMEEFSVSSLSSSSSSGSSDEECGWSSKHGGSGRYSLARTSEAIVCYPRSSLVAVMIQALTHRRNYIWVVEDDYSLVGIVTFAGMLKVFRSITGPRRKPE
ncbi:unnamed protein product [Ilex paraguariensis]|uniref:CBS domain-containing protein n=1 Tax=Ilex paraguariensis TaxID=185542 RepID=A0ABC8UL96_9AQUA